ncbi:MAG: ATP-binding protein [Proteobacteria bacterium]|nr:ATP-binding protein [Pseudomonadota bacterium]
MILDSLKHEPRVAICETHGDYTSRHIFSAIWSKCPVCAEEERARANIEAEARERQAKLDAWQRRIGESGIPERFHDRTLKSYKVENEGQRRALEFATAYADNFDDVLATGRNAMFIGKVGTGKNHLAAGIGLRIMHRDGRTVLCLTVMRAIRRVKDTWARGSTESETQAIAALTDPDLLILDEIGVQFGSQTENLILFDVLNERYERRRPTLLLSNLELTDVRAYLGERVYDRLREGGGEVVVFDWESHRCAS